MENKIFTSEVGFIPTTSTTTSFTDYMTSLIQQYERVGRARTSETYACARRSLLKFAMEQVSEMDEGIPFHVITADFLQAYESWLYQRGVKPNTVSFYMRILRAVYNRAVENGLAEPMYRHPFKHVYTGIAKTRKRALPISEIRRMKELNLRHTPRLAFARDIFLFSFYTRGMSFVDIAYLKKSDLKQDTLIYRRRKTGAELYIKWEDPMHEIIGRYPTPQSPYLFPIITDMRKDPRVQYLSQLHEVNHNLKKVAGMLSLDMPLSLYCARHSWASVAYESNVSLAVISQGMGHASEQVTRIYLADLQASIIDEANHRILSALL